MKIDLSCPVELYTYQLPTEKAAECAFMLNNLSDKVVSSVQVAMVCYGTGQSLLYRQVERVQGLTVAPGGRFSIVIMPTRWEGVMSVDLMIEKVWFDDAVIWRRGTNPLTDYEPNTLKPSRMLDTLRFVAGPDAVGYPSEQQGVWVCVCGRANPRSSMLCSRCERQKAAVFASYSKENIDQLIAVHEQRLNDQARRAREDASRLAEERQRKIDEKKRRVRQGWQAALAGACVLLLAAVILAMLPRIRYTAAKEALSQGRYADARAAFAQMGDYLDVPTLQNECDYGEALSRLGTDDVTLLTQSVKALEALGDYQDSPAQLETARFELADALLDADQPDEALAISQSLGDMAGVQEQITRANYLIALRTLDTMDYAAALDQFVALGDYQDSEEQAKECRYQLALSAVDLGEPEEAVAQLEQVGQYKDARTLMQSIAYQLGQQYEQQGHYEAASTYYRKASPYEDSIKKAQQCIYQSATAYMQQRQYDLAANAFNSIAGYEDATALGAQCTYAQASALESAGDYASATALYESIPGEKDASQRATECRYQQAVSELGSEQYESAEMSFIALGDYQDSIALLKRTRYCIGIELIAKGQYEQARNQLSLLGDYEDCARQIRECNYQIGITSLEGGDYQAAVDAFTAIRDDARVTDSLNMALYRLAKQYIDASDATSALPLIGRLPDGENKTELGDSVIATANALSEKGDLDSAYALYEGLGDYGSAHDKMLQCAYLRAEAAREKGDCLLAASLFSPLEGYQDAAEQRDLCYDAVYSAPAAIARKAYEDKDYVTAVEALRALTLSDLPSQYQDLAQVFNDAAYRQAERLYDQDKPYEALPYYRLIPDYEDVSARKLTRRCYLILGSWQTDDGQTAEFREDATCTLQGKTLYYQVDNNTLRTGDTPEALKGTHRLTALSQDQLTLRDNENNVTLQFTRVSEPAAAPDKAVSSDAQ